MGAAAPSPRYEEREAAEPGQVLSARQAAFPLRSPEAGNPSGNLTLRTTGWVPGVMPRPGPAPPSPTPSWVVSGGAAVTPVLLGKRPRLRGEVTPLRSPCSWVAALGFNAGGGRSDSPEEGTWRGREVQSAAPPPAPQNWRLSREVMREPVPQRRQRVDMKLPRCQIFVSHVGSPLPQAVRVCPLQRNSGLAVVGASVPGGQGLPGATGGAGLASGLLAWSLRALWPPESPLLGQEGRGTDHVAVNFLPVTSNPRL